MLSCCFDAFKFLAMNYLSNDAHPLFDEVHALLQDAINITLDDVAELLMPKHTENDVDSCLVGLVEALEKAKTEKKYLIPNQILEGGTVSNPGNIGYLSSLATLAAVPPLPMCPSSALPPLPAPPSSPAPPLSLHALLLDLLN
ncbi:hypothetical protein PR202_ga28049 [Eleusine coracana subsp. coracana]|uniref:AAA+ ATPase At3g28540-like C-terminal domain-containing protein n=1 Tax=Eleusine coracana subsp. coracana TaxID=191504 RepID=A0AAV5DHV5_ELECO|nr:hypothetical protein PR202_ga28049 [Eleusine coracana subsp. coracana]